MYFKRDSLMTIPFFISSTKKNRDSSNDKSLMGVIPKTFTLIQVYQPLGVNFRKYYFLLLFLGFPYQVSIIAMSLAF